MCHELTFAATTQEFESKTAFQVEVWRRCTKPLVSSIDCMSDQPAEATSTTATTPPPKRENLWVNLACNAILPGFLLTQLSKDKALGPVWGLVVSLALPVGYGIYDLISRRKWNVLSILGFVSILVSGVLGLTKTTAFWFAVKEAAFPLIIGLAIPLTLRTREPLVRALIYNDQLLDTARVQRALEARQNAPAFERLLTWASWVMAAAFAISAVLNFTLARWILTAAPGTPEFVAQLGKMHWVSWPVIVIPMMGMMFYALFRLLKGVEELSGLKAEEIFHQPPPKNRSA